MREGLQTVARTAKEAVRHPVDMMATVGGEAVRAAGGAAQQAVRLAGSGARYAGGVAESCLARAGLVGRRGVTELVRDRDESGGESGGAGPATTVTEPSIEDAAAEAVARQEARAAAESAAQVRRVAAMAEEEDDIRTPSGIPAADEGFNPDTNETDLVQPDTAEPGDPGTLHAIESEAETLRAAARKEKS